MKFSVTGTKIMRILYIIIWLSVAGLIGYGNYLLLKVYPESGIEKSDLMLAYGISIGSDIVTILFGLYLLHMVFDIVYVDGRQIVNKRLFRKAKRYDVDDINRWSSTFNHIRTYWTKVITIHIGKEYIDITCDVHSNFDEMGKYLWKYCPKKRVAMITHW